MMWAAPLWLVVLDLVLWQLPCDGLVLEVSADELRAHLLPRGRTLLFQALSLDVEENRASLLRLLSEGRADLVQDYARAQLTPYNCMVLFESFFLQDPQLHGILFPSRLIESNPTLQLMLKPYYGSGYLPDCITTDRQPATADQLGEEDYLLDLLELAARRPALCGDENILTLLRRRHHFIQYWYPRPLGASHSIMEALGFGTDQRGEHGAYRGCLTNFTHLIQQDPHGWYEGFQRLLEEVESQTREMGREVAAFWHLRLIAVVLGTLPDQGAGVEPVVEMLIPVFEKYKLDEIAPAAMQQVFGQMRRHGIYIDPGQLEGQAGVLLAVRHFERTLLPCEPSILASIDDCAAAWYAFLERSRRVVERLQVPQEILTAAELIEWWSEYDDPRSALILARGRWPMPLQWRDNSGTTVCRSLVEFLERFTPLLAAHVESRGIDQWDLCTIKAYCRLEAANMLYRGICPSPNFLILIYSILDHGTAKVAKRLFQETRITSYIPLRVIR